jgi:hypothetical protein
MISPGREPGGNGVSKPISPGRGDTIRRATSSLLPPLPGLVGIKSRKPRACARGYILPRLRRFPWLRHYLNRSKSIKIRISSRGCSCRLSPRRRGEDEGEGWICRGATLGCVDANPHPHPSPLAREKRPMLAPCHPYTKNRSRIWETSE